MDDIGPTKVGYHVASKHADAGGSKPILRTSRMVKPVQVVKLQKLMHRTVNRNEYKVQYACILDDVVMKVHAKGSTHVWLREWCIKL